MRMATMGFTHGWRRSSAAVRVLSLLTVLLLGLGIGGAIGMPEDDASRQAVVTAPSEPALVEAIEEKASEPAATAPPQSLAPAPAPAPPLPRTQVRRSAPPPRAPAPAPVCDRACVRRPGAVRVLVIGDSIMWQVRDWLAGVLRAQGHDAMHHAVAGTGLLTGVRKFGWIPEGFNWITETQMLVEKFDPDIVVAEFMGVYFQPEDGSGYVYASPEFIAAWARATAEVMRNLTARHAAVYWVLAPPLADRYWNRGVNITNQIYRELAPAWPATAEHSAVHHIDEISPLSAPDGSYAQFVAGPDGEQLRIREDDGVHLAPVGMERFIGQITGSLAGYSREAFRAP